MKNKENLTEFIEFRVTKSEKEKLNTFIKINKTTRSKFFREIVKKILTGNNQ